jgi:RNA polymerase sigma-70 factor (ECF subfamily)
MTVEGEQLGIAFGLGDDTAWERVVSLEAKVGSRLYGYAVHLGVDGPRAHDVVQDALLRLWREVRRGAVVAAPEPWLFRTVARLAMDEHRLHRRVLRLMTSLGERLTPTVMEVETTERAALWAAVDQLPPRQRQVLFLRFRADLTYEEVGHVMGITPAAVRSHASQALVTLRARLGDDGRAR